ncbi:Rv3654c family TadE-like protein [Candidatus Mycolicibacterium alkanivorans]
MIVVVVTIAMAGVRVGSAVVARHRAQAAADLAALAAAARLPDGPAAACEGARGITGAMGAELAGCDVAELDVVVAVAVAVGGWSGGQARASARAGPVVR